ncbi:ABC transporter ATP-binding protein [Lampropedia puyangensis]|uniref:ABC transporter ATP-binding protein n=1 Tax=Lampropedia puyangensis TaxID=1330072 RepID=A0A4S8F8Y2_9BURK|nr:ABC transporter ATP-binding protein [Lampropedia puyangensis]THU04048.1 ABC transporter ATP-binding protein [Lampropedia puyangensis]
MQNPPVFTPSATSAFSSSQDHTAPVQGASIEVHALQRQFGSFQALRQIDFTLPAGRVLALLGPSGCGKSTLLKLLAGLDRPSSGSIAFAGRVVADAATFVAPQQRKLGMVFQDYALWPHMSVGGNVGFALRMQGVRGHALQERVDRVLQQVGLADMASRSPSALSGGQQQRVALARAIVAQPSVLLFDEPLSNLDRDLRESLCGEMRQLLRDMGTTAVYVTHDHEEACLIADEVAVMFQGEIAQRCSPQQLWGAPATVQVARFLKLGALLPAWSDGHTIGLAQQHDVQVLASLPAQHINHTGTVQAGVQRMMGHLLVPDDAVTLKPAPTAEEVRAGVLSAQVVEQHYTSGRYKTRLQLCGADQAHDVHAWTRERLPVREGHVALQLDMAQLRWFASQTT